MESPLDKPTNSCQKLPAIHKVWMQHPLQYKQAVQVQQSQASLHPIVHLHLLIIMSVLEKKVVIMSKSISMHYKFVNQKLEQSYFQTVCKFDHLKRINFNNLLYSLQKI